MFINKIDNIQIVRDILLGQYNIQCPSNCGEGRVCPHAPSSRVTINTSPETFFFVCASRKRLYCCGVLSLCTVLLLIQGTVRVFRCVCRVVQITLLISITIISQVLHILSGHEPFLFIKKTFQNLFAYIIRTELFQSCTFYTCYL